MIALNRRAILGALAGLLALVATPALARTIVDSSGRQVQIPDSIHRVFAAGPPASILLYFLAPQTMVGWTNPPNQQAQRFLLPSVRSLPALGRLTGRGETLNLEGLIANKPDLVIDFGTIDDTYKSLADRVQAQTGIPYLLIDGRFNNTPAALRLLGDVLGVKDRGETLAKAAEQIFADVDHVVASVPEANRPRVYLARGSNGLESGSRGSINTEIIERVGGINVVQGLRDKGGLVDASPEQIIAWAPDTIITIDRGFQQSVRGNATWQPVPAVAAGRVYLAPSLPFGFIDSPPALNRLIGLTWLLHKLYPAQAPGNVRDQIRDFYHLFYQVDLSNADLDDILAGSGD